MPHELQINIQEVKLQIPSVPKMLTSVNVLTDGFTRKGTKAKPQQNFVSTMRILELFC